MDNAIDALGLFVDGTALKTRARQEILWLFQGWARLEFRQHAGVINVRLRQSVVPHRSVTTPVLRSDRVDIRRIGVLKTFEGDRSVNLLIHRATLRGIPGRLERI